MTTVRSSVRRSCLAVKCRQWRGRNAGGLPGLLTDGRVTSFPFLPFVFFFNLRPHLRAACGAIEAPCFFFFQPSRVLRFETS